MRLEMVCFVKRLLAIAAVLFVTSCGGGGSTPTAPQDSSNWDEMVWNQDKWK